MGSPRLSVAVGSAWRSHIISLVSDWHRHGALLSLPRSLSSFPLASAQSLLTPTDALHFVLFFILTPFLSFSPDLLFSCLLFAALYSHFLSMYNCGFSHWLSDSEQGPLKSSHLSVFAGFSLFSRSAFFRGISLPVSPRGSPLWITIQFSPNYLVAFAAFDT